MQSANPTEVVSSHPTLTEGQQVGGCFLLKRELFQSRGVRIWLAQDEILGKEVTLHVVPDSIFRDERAMTELRQEVKRNRQLIHPNILRVYDLVEDPGLVAVAMDRFEGQSLAELLQQKGAFEGEEIRAWLQQIGETLNDAHRIQLFHRDLSPANFIVRPGGAVLVTNFGLSRVIGEAMERAGQIKGDITPLSYLSPQQIDGEKPTSQDDVYGMGVLAFELLTGRPPFTGEGVVAAIRKAAPANVNEVRASAGRSPVPAAWERFVNSCLAKAAESRPKSCVDALAILEGAKGASVIVPEVKKPVEEAAPVKKAEVPPPVKRAEAPPSKKAEVPPPVPAPASAPEPPKTTIASVPSKAPATAAQLPPTPPGNGKPKPMPALSANYPDLERPKSKLPLVGLGVAASVLAAALYFKNDAASNTGVGSAVSRVEDSGAGALIDPSTAEAPLLSTAGGPGAELTPVNASGEPEAATPVPEIVSTSGADEPSDLIAAADPGATKKEGRGLIGATPGKPAKPPVAKPVTPAAAPAETPAAPAPAPTPAAPTDAGEPRNAAGSQAFPLPPAPAPLPKLTLPEKPDPEQLAKLLAERQAAATKFAEAAAAAEKVQAANASFRGIRQEELDAQKKTLEEKKKTLSPVIKASAELEAEKKRLEEAMAKTDAAAKEAARAAEAAKKSYEELLSTSGQKTAAMQKAESELAAANQAVSTVNKEVEELSQGATKAEAQRQQMLLAKRQADQEAQQLSAALEKATKAQREAMVKANKPKITALEQQIKEVDEQVERYQKAVGSLQALNDDSTKAAIQQIQEKINAANTQKATLQDEIKRLSGVAPAAPSGASVPAAETKPAAAVETKPAVKPAEVATTKPAVETKPELAPLPEPKPAVVPEAKPAVTAAAVTTNPAAMIAKVDTNPAAAAVAKAADAPKTGANSLGMTFVKVGDVDFSVHLVTRANFEAFSKATNLKPEHWRNPGFEQTPDHPVVNVTWKEADSFCKWLTEKERKTPLLKPTEYYRLPTDSEWSKAVGLPAESGATPEERDMRVEDIYPWGTQWPPPVGAGNFAGEETVTELPIEGYNDKFPNTSPVGAFKANSLGLYDMGGNVWQWVQDSFDGSGPAKTLRGGSWYNGAIKMSLLSSCRIKSSPETINDTYGFRIVKSADGKSKR